MTPRRRARECALMMLYAMDARNEWNDVVVERFWSGFATGEPLDPLPPYMEPAEEEVPFAVAAGEDEVRRFADALVGGVCEHREAIDREIMQTSHNWRLDRMALVDRNVLRLGAFELLMKRDDVPRKVAINEAIEIAKTFGTAESGAFVNGILDRIGR